MSHFLLAVLHTEEQIVEEMLAPYDENLKVKPYLVYTKTEAIQHARQAYEECRSKSDKECWDFIADGYETDENGNIFSTYNPKAKLDYFNIGGGWEGYLRVNSERVNEARIGDIDFSPNSEEYNKALRYWDVIVEHQPAKPDEDFFSFYDENYYINCYGTRERYAKICAIFSTHAVITPDGEWHESGHMGWFGASSETPQEAIVWKEQYVKRFIENADPSLILTIVDCHI